MSFTQKIKRTWVLYMETKKLNEEYPDASDTVKKINNIRSKYLKAKKTLDAEIGDLEQTVKNYHLGVTDPITIKLNALKHARDLLK